MAFYQLKTRQHLPANRRQVWTFISDPSNLKRITPEDMGFDILDQSLPSSMYPGMIIRYRVHPLFGIGITWVTEITQIKEGEFFIDEQRLGPYAFWHHQHRILSDDDGVWMEDLVSYAPPLGPLGTLVHPLLIRPRLREIFDFREKALMEIFGQSEKNGDEERI